jgi:hypothetical protein
MDREMVAGTGDWLEREAPRGNLARHTPLLDLIVGVH